MDRSRKLRESPTRSNSSILTAFEIDPEWIIECASRRQKWIDMGQSLNLYLAEPSGKKLHQMYMLAWEKGLKTNYYLRSLAATQIEKSTVDINKRGLQPRWMKNKSASSNISSRPGRSSPKAMQQSARSMRKLPIKTRKRERPMTKRKERETGQCRRKKTDQLQRR